MSSFNTGAWSEEEHKRFLVGYKKHGATKNYNAIADIVKTRSEQQVRSRLWYIETNPKGQALLRDDKEEENGETMIREGTWSEREKKAFLEGYKKYGNRNWNAIVDMVKTRTKQQVMGRHASLMRKQRQQGHDIFAELEDNDDDDASLDVETVRQGKWSEREKKAFLKGFKKYGNRNWNAIVDMVKTRTKQQVISRAAFLLNKQREGHDVFAEFQADDEKMGGSLKSSPKRAARVSLSPSSPSKSFNTGPWSEEEKRLFDVGLRKYGRGQWKKIAALIGTRDNVQVCTHGWSCSQKMKVREDTVGGVQECDEDIRNPPRKRAARVSLSPSSSKHNQEKKKENDEESSVDKKGASMKGKTSSRFSSESEKKRRAVEDIPSSRVSTKKQRRSMSTKKTITILGATGGTGICLVKQALAAGHEVKALVRSPEKLSYELSLNKNLTVTKGDVTKYEDVKAAINGSTDVVVCLGGRGKDSKICSTAQPFINKALNDTDPNMRLVVVTSMAVGDSYHDVTWMTRRFADLVIASSIKDKNLQERHVIRDVTNWVLVRPVGLSNGELTRKAEGDPHAAPAASKTMSRADLAHFILTQCLGGQKQDKWKRNPVTVYPPQ